MQDPQNPQSDKNRKSRSFGSFLLFLTVLVAIVIMVGSESLDPHEKLTQDQYEYYLYTGQVESQEFKGANQIEGRLRNDRRFKAGVLGLNDRESLYQQVKAIRHYTLIDTGDLMAAVEGRFLQPSVARWVTTYEEQESTVPVKSESSVEQAQKQETIKRDELFVQAHSQPAAAWEAANPGEEAPAWLPEKGGSLWFEVQDLEDPVALVGLLAARGAEQQQLTFDVTPKEGTRWQDSSSLLGTALLVWGPWLLIIVVFLIFMRQMRNQGGAGGVMAFGRSRAQLYSKENHTNVTFSDVAGAEEAKDEVQEIVEFLKNPGRFTRIGGRIPRGVLLVGPPGCGKTLLAKAIAGEAEVPFFSISGSDFVEMFVGVGASRVRDLFKQARENSPCIIFLDEIDAVGRRRGSGMGGGHDEREQTLNAILVEMDGFGTDEGIIVVAATNRPDVLDPALLRPGRFDREVTIDLPDLAGREAILKVHLGKVRSGSDVDPATLARSTPGYSGADLAAIINEAAIMAALGKHEEVSMEHLEEARDKVRYGRQKKSRQLEEEDRKITAYHEAGHAVVAASIEEVDPPHKVTIVPRGRALGATMILPDKESYHQQKKRMIGQLAVLFGGRVSEALFCGDISAGASDDIHRATDLARAMVTELGMSEKVGPINYSERQGSDFLGTELMSSKWHSEETAREIDEEVQRFLREAYARAEQIVRDNAQAVEHLTQGLLHYETITGREINELLAGRAIADLRPPKEAPPEPAPTPPEGKAEGRSVSNDGDLPGLSGEAGLSPA